MPRLLVVDDEAEIGRFVCAVAKRCGYLARSVQEAQAFQTVYRMWQPDMVVLDLAIPGADGIELLRFLAGQKSRARIVLISGLGPMLGIAERLGQTYGLDVAAALEKPIRVATLQALLCAEHPDPAMPGIV